MPSTSKMVLPPLPSAELQQRVRLIAESYTRLLGTPLVAEDSDDFWQTLWSAPKVIVAHGTEADPLFFYGNALALSVFEMDFAAFTQLPSRYSAEPLLREERAALLERVSRDGYIDNYAGMRIASSGKRFLIEQAVVWNLQDDKGQLQGQAATFDRWKPL